ncbi:MAG: hypothetical protein E7L01_25750 [Paenibacillus macerans]|uniref:Lipoprotein n=1 Tax=Paenibacillus macerans TaxID=44252 RepID=A0A6N8EP28_PAEMA|nr:hypothetical protein [Paenibacillus macerans]MBS5909918.1 hypothetical protein [Paenibacillus macerans]MDU5950279.1 hypothetical protein [Paenibacillus macerans]MDU7476718.1 hypothetical protein [Paenibacillus macerans]MEC0135947.1 hypothetical protein [Paenibacillus macerans]MUG21707.1 hypothetical protein [Paenibacillus macerans]
MNWCKLGLGLVLAVSLSTGCGNGMQKVAKQEMEKYNMNSYRKGNHRQLTSGTTLNTSLLRSLKAECAERGIRLTHETYAEGLDGNISYSYFINGDARHFIIVHVFPSEQDRIREMTEIYGSGDGSGDGKKGLHAAAAASQASVIRTRDNAALVYASTAQKNSQYREQMKTIFDRLLMRMQDRAAQ